MKAKKVILFSLIFFVLIIAAVAVVMGISHDNTYDNSHEIKTTYYTEDYPELYKEELQIIFGENYRIGEKETITEEGEDCSCGYHSDTYIYNQWEISYEDQLGQEYTQTLNNVNTLENQQIGWLKEQLKQHYKKQFLVEHFAEGTFQDLSVEENGSTYCFVFLGNLVHTYKSGENQEDFERAMKADDIYQEQLLEDLGNKEKMIHLWELDYQQIFRNFPMYVTLQLRIDDEELAGDEKAEFEEAVREKILQMIEEVKEESGYTCNLFVHVSCAGKDKLYDGESSWHYAFIQGQTPEAGRSYEWQLFDSYEGVFW